MGILIKSGVYEPWGVAASPSINYFVAKLQKAQTPGSFKQHTKENLEVCSMSLKTFIGLNYLFCV